MDSLCKFTLLWERLRRRNPSRDLFNTEYSNEKFTLRTLSIFAYYAQFAYFCTLTFFHKCRKIHSVVVILRLRGVDHRGKLDHGIF